MHLTTGNIILIATVLVLLIGVIAFGSWSIGFVMGEASMNDEWCDELLANPYLFRECW